jgi:replicative DNA helicase
MGNKSNVRTIPHSHEAEKGLISSIMQLPNKLDDFGEKLSPEHFFVPGHAVICSALQRMHEARKPIELGTITDFLRDDGQLENVGGAAYLTELYTFVPTAAAAEYYLDQVKRKWLRRATIRISTELIRESYDELNRDEEDLLEEAQRKITALSLEATKIEAFRHVKPGVHQMVEDMEKIFHRRGDDAVLGMESGFLDIDRMTGGIQNQQYIIIGARPSQGKTAIAVNMAAHMAVKNQIPILFFTLEMSYDQIVRRFGACTAGINLKHFRDGFWKHDWQETVLKDLEPLSNAPIWIDDVRDAGTLTIAAFKAKARRAKVKLGIKAIFVDFLQLMRAGTRHREVDLRVETTEISQALKSTAKELDIPVIACAQLSRKPEDRLYGAPKMGDLRESGSLEQDADVLILLWRPLKHLENKKQREGLAKALRLHWRPNEPIDSLLRIRKGEGASPLYKTEKDTELDEEELKERDRQLEEYAELQVVKQRDGPTNDSRVRFIGHLMRFQNTTEKAWTNKADERQIKT